MVTIDRHLFDWFSCNSLSFLASVHLHNSMIKYIIHCSHLLFVDFFKDKANYQFKVAASFQLASTCVSVWPHDLQVLALICDDLRSVWSRSNVHASQRKVFHPLATQRKSTQVLLFTSSTELQCAQKHWNWLFDNLRALASPFGQLTSARQKLHWVARQKSPV